MLTLAETLMVDLAATGGIGGDGTGGAGGTGGTGGDGGAGGAGFKPVLGTIAQETGQNTSNRTQKKRYNASFPFYFFLNELNKY